MTGSKMPGDHEIKTPGGPEPLQATGGPGAPDELAHWAARAREGDLEAFEALYRATSGRVYALCLRLGGDPVRAEDLMQEVYLRAWERLGRFEGRAKFSTWLYRLAANRILDILRAEALRAGEPLVQEEDGAGPATPAPVTSRNEGTRIDLERAIRELPTGARTVFVLHDVEGYAHDEIAALLGIGPGTSKSQLSRARRLLRERLSQ